MKPNPIPKITCRECDKVESLQYLDNVRNKLIKRKLCHNCNFWIEKVDMANNPNSVRVNGVYYFINPEHTCPGVHRGFSGKIFTILFNDGQKFITTNLWGQGIIPDRFKERLPDNAIFEEE